MLKLQKIVIFILLYDIFNIITTIHSKTTYQNPIIQENILTGSSNWWIPQSELSTTYIHSFAESISYNPNDIVHFKIDCPSYIPKYNLEIYRLGYYQGLGGRLLANVTILNKSINKQPKCNFEYSTKMTDCSNWKRTFSWKIPSSMISSIMIGLPVYYHNIDENDHTNINNTIKKYVGNYIPFIIRSNRSIGSDILFKTSDLTWVAYNKYGDYNVYRGNGSYSFSSRAYKASYDRPWQNRYIAPEGQHQNFLFGSEFPMLFWLEKHGYDVSYASCSDVEELLPYYDSNHLDYNKIRRHNNDKNNHKNSRNDRIVEFITSYKVLLSIGHDEYWTPKLKYIYEYARELGVHLAFFSGNEMFWRVIWDNDTTIAMDNNNNNNNHHKRIFKCYKETIDNITISKLPTNDWTGTFRDPRVRIPEPENAVTGQLFMVNAHRNDSLNVRYEHSFMRFWRHTSFSNDQYKLKRNSLHYSKDKHVVYTSSQGVLGYEWDIFADDDARPPGLVSLSSTTKYINRSLLIDYGAAYNGTGFATHKLSLYRYQSSTIHSKEIVSMYAKNLYDIISPTSELHKHISSKFDNIDILAEHICKKYFYNSSSDDTIPSTKHISSLVFGAGTVQWSWALSAWHDGYRMPIDIELQQATLNLLADMNVYPLTLDTKLVNNSSRKLIYPKISDDYLAPKSYIESATFHVSNTYLPYNTKRMNASILNIKLEHRSHHHILKPMKSRNYLTIRGTVEDYGGGVVAGIEISLNGGKTWRVATLLPPPKSTNVMISLITRRWYYNYPIEMLHYYNNNNNTTITTNSYECCMKKGYSHMTVIQYFEYYRDAVLFNHCKCDGYKRYHSTEEISMLVMSRAVDDSGWLEKVLDAPHLICHYHYLTQNYKHNNNNNNNNSKYQQHNQKDNEQKSNSNKIIPMTKIISNIVVLHMS